MNTFAKMLAVVTATALLAGCASNKYEMDERDAALAKTLQEGTLGESTRCIHMGGFNNVDTLSEKQLLFRGSGNKAWVNDLAHRCPWMEHYHILEFRQGSGFLCELDEVRGRNSMFLSWGDAGPWCRLGPFRSVDEDTAEKLHELRK